MRSRYQYQVWARNLRQAASELLPPGALAEADQAFAAMPAHPSIEEILNLPESAKLAVSAYANIMMIADDLEAEGNRL